MMGTRDYSRNYQQTPVIISGTDGEDFNIADVDNQGRLLCRQLLWDPDILNWVAETADKGAFGDAYLGKVHGNPLSYTEGDWWYDLDAHLYKGYNGTNVVNL